ncbi:MAG: hypothetical protein AAFR17_09130 [Pseudomonadota bacterium]
MSAQPLQITELDKALQGDADGRVVKAYVNQLSEGKRRVQAKLDGGVTTAELTRLTNLTAAYDAGIDALPKIWAAINQPNS